MMKMKCKQRKHGETFLTKVRWRTLYEWDADNSMFVYGDDGHYYTLSLLGVINGFLNKVGLVLVSHVNTKTKEITKWQLRKKWW